MRLIVPVFLLFAFSILTSCKNIVSKFDRYVHKTYLRKGYVNETFQTKTHQINYYDNKREEAPVLLFIHGFGGDGKISWKSQAMAFEEDYRVIVPDILWFGESKSLQTPELQTQINAINELIENLKLENIHVVGISYGGFISLGIGHQNQSKLASLTIVDSPGVHFTDKELQEFCDKIGVDNIADAFLPENSKEVKRMLDFTFRKAPKLPAGIREQTIGIYLAKNPEEQRELLENLPQNRNEFRDLDIDVPVLILWGEEDEIFLISDAEELQAQLGAKLIIIPKAGHSLPAEQPKAFNKALSEFIEEIDSNVLR